MPWYIPVRGAPFWDDLRRRLRGGRWYLSLLLYVLALNGSLIYAYTALLPRVSAYMAHNMLGALLVMNYVNFQFPLIMLVSMAATAGAFAGERESGTLERLLETPISTRALVWGRYFGAVCQLVLIVLSGLPTLLLIYIYWGVSARVYSVINLPLMIFELAVHAMLGAAVGLFLSSLCARRATALGWAYGALFFSAVMRLCYQFWASGHFNLQQISRMLISASFYLFSLGSDPVWSREFNQPLLMFMYSQHMGGPFIRVFSLLLSFGEMLLVSFLLLVFTMKQINWLRRPLDTLVPPWYLCVFYWFADGVKRILALPPVDDIKSEE